MITWLQLLIEKRGKWLFIVLLGIVIISFVPYISPTGSSSLDFFADDPYSQSDDYFNYDWNDPNDMAELNAAYEAASVFGTISLPSQEVMEVLDQGFHQSLFGAWQSAIQSRQNPEQAREILQMLQTWPSHSQEKKAQIIAGTLQAPSEFRISSIEAKIALLQIAAAWNLLPTGLDNKAIAKKFREFVASRADDRLGISTGGELDTAKFDQGVQNLANNLKKPSTDIKEFLFEDFRADQVDAVLKVSGFALPVEAQLDLRSNDLLWTFEASALDFDAFEPKPLPFASIHLRSFPENNATITLNYDNEVKTFRFLETLPANPAEGDVAIGAGDSDQAKLRSTRDNLAAIMKKAGLNFVVNESAESEDSPPAVELSLPSAGVPFEMPEVILGSQAFSVTNELRDELIAYYDAHKQDDMYMDPSRTQVTALGFDYQTYLKNPTPPTESELRQYFVLHPGDFSRPVAAPLESNATEPAVNPDEDGQRGPTGSRDRKSPRKSRVSKKDKEEKPSPANPAKKDEASVNPASVPQPIPESKPAVPAPEPASTELPQPIPAVDQNSSEARDDNATGSGPALAKPEVEPAVTFDEVRQQVFERVMKERREALELEARERAEKRAEDLVGSLHALSRDLSGQTDALGSRKDPAVQTLIDESKPKPLLIDPFSEGEIDKYAQAAGLPADALSDMLDLPSHRFFSEATYPTTDGFAVMLLDARLPAAVKDFEKADFRVMLREFREERKQEAFQNRGEELAETFRKGLEEGTPLTELVAKVDLPLSYHSFQADDEDSIRRIFNKKTKKLEREEKAAKARLEKFVATKDQNATAEEPADIVELRAEIKALATEIGDIDDEIALSIEILEIARDSQTKPDALTGMLTGNITKAGLFVRLQEVILEIDDDDLSLTEERIKDLEALRIRQSRENLLGDWIAKGRMPR